MNMEPLMELTGADLVEFLVDLDEPFNVLPTQTVEVPVWTRPPSPPPPVPADRRITRKYHINELLGLIAQTRPNATVRSMAAVVVG